jgi:anti-sigma factor RsiW
MSGLDDDILQQLYDGELDTAEAEKAHKAVADHADDAKRLESLSQMRILIRAEAEAAADAADFEGLWPAVAAQIQPELQTAPSAAARASLTQDQDQDQNQNRGMLARFKAWLGMSMGGHPVRWAVAGACAVAMAVALGVLLSSALKPEGIPVKKSAAKIESGDDVDIEEMEFKGRHPDIFQIKDGKRTTTVIWVYPEDEDDEENGADAGDDPGSSDPI